MRILGFNSQAANTVVESQYNDEYPIGADAGPAGHPVFNNREFWVEQARLAAARRAKAHRDVAAKLGQ